MVVSPTPRTSVPSIWDLYKLKPGRGTGCSFHQFLGLPALSQAVRCCSSLVRKAADWACIRAIQGLIFEASTLPFFVPQASLNRLFMGAGLREICKRVKIEA